MLIHIKTSALKLMSAVWTDKKENQINESGEISNEISEILS